MNTSRTALLAAVLQSIALAGCAATTHPATAASLGVPCTQADVEAVLDTPGPVDAETIDAASWKVDRKGLIDLDDPKAKAAGLVDGDEPIELFLHALHHPTRGLWLVDSGVERAFTASPDDALIAGMTADMAHLDKMIVHTDTATFLARRGEPVRGVFLTHLHLDHVLGLRDVPRGVPVLVGPGDAEERGFMNVFTSSIFDRALAGKPALAEWSFDRSRGAAGPELDAVLDVFGDRTIFAIAAPGHTPGSTAYLARTPRGPVMFLGDVSHTAWGYEHDVPPGTFSEDAERSRATFEKTRRFLAKHPGVEIHLGHQHLASHEAR